MEARRPSLRSRVRAPAARTTQAAGHGANVTLRLVVQLVMQYEAYALSPGSTLPSISGLCWKHRRLVPVILLGLAVHLYWPVNPQVR